MTKIVVLDGYTLCPGDLSWEPLCALGDVTVYDRTPAGEVLARIGDAPVVLTNKTVISREVMAACPNLRYIGVLATGYNVVDIAAAAEMGIVVTNVPAYSTQAVAQHTMALLLHCASHVALYDARVKEGGWVKSPDFCFYAAPSVELAGKTLGLVGFGSIGRAVARAAQALGMHVVIHTRTQRPELLGEDMCFVTLDELLSESDVITLHCPLTADNKGLIGEAALEKTKCGVRVINTARGPLVDSKAMANALGAGKVACYMTDVMDVEPPAADNPLLSAPNVVITPHVAWAPYETRARLLDIAVGNVKAFLSGAPCNVVHGGRR